MTSHRVLITELVAIKVNNIQKIYIDEYQAYPLARKTYRVWIDTLERHNNSTLSTYTETTLLSVHTALKEAKNSLKEYAKQIGWGDGFE